MPIITLTTDFGHQDAFVGVMKGVILGIAPEARIVDLCHEIPPQDLVAAALQLEAALPYFPRRTIHVVVVDPGVGTDRAAIAVSTERAILVGPDNGVIPAAIGGADKARHAVRLTKTGFPLQPTSRTFHGRDIFAPCAAQLALGLPLKALGEPIADLVALSLPSPEWVGKELIGHVVHTDRFGNLVTDVRISNLADEVGVVTVAGREIPIRSTYGEVEAGDLVAYFGSSNRLEIAVRNGSAAEALGPVDEFTVAQRNQ
jgi:S-adenosylmethionine hydrolase